MTGPLTRAHLTRQGLQVCLSAYLMVCWCGLAVAEPAKVAVLLQHTPTAGGTILPEPGVYHIEQYTELTITAVANPGYEFVYWLGHVSDPTARRTVVYVDRPMILIAVFARAEYGIRGVASSGGGAATGSGRAATSSFGPVRVSFSQPSRVSAGSGSSRSSSPSPPFDPGPGPVITPEPPITPPTDPPGTEPPEPPEPPIPEPATGLLLLAGSALVFRKRRN